MAERRRKGAKESEKCEPHWRFNRFLTTVLLATVFVALTGIWIMAERRRKAGEWKGGLPVGVLYPPYNENRAPFSGIINSPLSILNYLLHGLGGGEGGFVVGFGADVCNVLNVAHDIVFIDHKDSADQQALLWDKHTKGWAKASIFVVR
jgi:hypothetical protein